MRLTQRGLPVIRGGEVVERPEEEDGIGRTGIPRQRAGIADGRAGQRRPAGGLEPATPSCAVQRTDVEALRALPPRGAPAGVAAPVPPPTSEEGRALQQQKRRVRSGRVSLALESARSPPRRALRLDAAVIVTAVTSPGARATPLMMDGVISPPYGVHAAGQRPGDPRDGRGSSARHAARCLGRRRMSSYITIYIRMRR